MHDLILFGAGIIVGAMNSIAGGGMLVGFPVMLALGLPALSANVTANIVIMPGSLSSAFGYRDYIRKVPKRYLLLVVPCVLGAAIGALLLRNTSTEQFDKFIPALVLFAVLLFAFQPYLHFHLHKHMKRKSKAFKPLVLIALALLPVAVYGGYFGAGFGFIMLAFLGFTKLHEIHKMNGLKNLASVTIASTSLICLLSTGLINWHFGLVMAAGGIIGGYYGSVLTQRFSTHAIRVVVIAIGLTTVTWLGLRTY
ncbi:MAG: sulfite exporter TauE/SafE family protein [Patescibacteria group bacterium]